MWVGVTSSSFFIVAVVDGIGERVGILNGYEHAMG